MKKIDIGHALKRGFRVPLENKIIFIPALLIGLTVYLVSVFTGVYLASNITSTLSSGNIFGIFGTLLPVIIVSALINIFLSNVLYKLAYDSYKKKPNLENAKKIALKKYISVLGASIVEAGVVTLGLLLFIIPGIYFALRLSFFRYAILVDNKKAIESLKYSWKITKGNVRRLLAIYIVIVGVSLAVTLVLFPFALTNNLYISSIDDLILTALLTPWTVTVFAIIYDKLKSK